MNIHPTTAGVLCGTAAGAFAGLIFIFPELSRGFTPLQLTVARYTAFGVIALVFLLPRLRKILPHLTRRDYAVLAGLAVTGNTLYYVFLSNAVQLAGVALTSLVHGLVPVVVTVVGSRDRGAVSINRLMPSILLSCAGIMCIGWQALTPANLGAISQQAVGFLCAVGALASWSIYAVWNSRSLGRLNALSSYDWNLLVGTMTGAQGLILLPFALSDVNTNHSGHDWAQLGLAALGIAVLCSIVGNALWNTMSRLLPLTLAGQMFLSETIFALLYGLIWDQRWPTPLEMTALTLVVASVLSCISAHRPTSNCIISHV